MYPGWAKYETFRHREIARNSTISMIHEGFELIISGKLAFLELEKIE